MSKEEILNIAEKQMKAGGYESLSFRLIAEELGISKANVHHHFKTKTALAIEVANHYANIHHVQMLKMAEEFSPNYIEFLCAIEEMFWQDAKKGDDCKICVCAQLTREANVPEELLTVATGHFDLMFEIFMKQARIAHDAGTVRQDIPAESIAIQTGIIMNGLMAVSQNFSSVKEAKEILNGQASKLAHSFKP